MYPELIVREVLAVGQQAKYAPVDMGIRENISRGAATSGLKRSLDNGFVVWVTFLPDTLHNRSVLLQKKGLSIFIPDLNGGYELLNQTWIETLFGDLEATRVSMGRILPPNMDAGTPLRARGDSEGTSAEDTVNLAQGQAVSSGLPTNIAPTAPAAANPIPPMPGTKMGRKPGSKAAKAPEATEPAMPSAEGEIASFADFLALSFETQLQLVEAGQMPTELVQEIITYSGDKMRGEVIEAAFMKSTQ